MNAQGHWAKFSDAIRDLEASSKVANFRRDLFATAAHLLSIAQRFYLPDAVNILEGRAFDADVKSLIRLPYEVVALLSECGVIDGPMDATWKITLAIDPGGAVNKRMDLWNPDTFPNGSFPILSIVRTAGLWVLMPMWCGILFRDDRGIDLRIDVQSKDLVEEIERRGGRPATHEFFTDVTAITNLCAILNLHNTRTEPIPPPAQLQKSRRLRRKKPLYDYHVLVVDGERWDSPHVTEDTGAGVRSHLRRGHIRRLSAERHTWVRATYVHGSVPGFVDKDYEVKHDIRVS